MQKLRSHNREYNYHLPVGLQRWINKKFSGIVTKLEYQFMQLLWNQYYLPLTLEKNKDLPHNVNNSNTTQ